MTLKELEPGQSARITAVGGQGALRQHFLDMGVIPGAVVTLIKLAPLGDPMELRIHGYELTLRSDDAQKIDIVPEDSTVHEAPQASHADRRPPREHPGLGETGRYHDKRTETPIDPAETLTFALVGNQNCGKTTLFNSLTGSNQHVGNFPGVTVERKSGAVRGMKNTNVTDLPGIYSMSPYTSEEIVSRDFVLREKPKAIINIVDASNIERNLYLTMQLLEMDVPMVVALNMMDEVRANGGSVDINTMEAMLGVPVVPISAAKDEGIDELIRHAVHIACYNEKPVPADLCDSEANGGAVHRCIHAVCHLIDDHAKKEGLPVRFAASKLIEGDELIREQLRLDDNEKDMLEHIAIQLEKERGLDRNAAIAEMRFSYIRKVCDCSVIKPHESRERVRSEKIDRILTGRFTAVPMFILIIAAVFLLTFNVIGPFLQDLLEQGISWLTDLTDKALTAVNANDVIHGLIINGVFEGVGSVLSFMPVIVVLFFFLSLLEDSGYIARVAFFMDKPMRKAGLSGRSIVPLLIGFGCTVPAVMATRTLPSDRDRKMTILLTPFMSCSAKLPIYGFFVNAFFPEYGGLIMVGIYLLGIVCGIGAAILYKKTLFKGEAVPFVMELPNYRLPAPKNVLRLLWEKAKDFLQRAFTVIFIATVIIWFLKSFDFNLSMVSDPSRSVLAAVAGVIAPLLIPLGIGDWKISVSLITGFLAKESVVSTLRVLYGGDDAIAGVLTPLAGAALLVFSLLYTPCVAAVASVRRELGVKWAAGVVLWQCFIAWIAAFVIRAVLILCGVS